MHGNGKCWDDLKFPWDFRGNESDGKCILGMGMKINTLEWEYNYCNGNDFSFPQNLTSMLNDFSEICDPDGPGYRWTHSKASYTIMSI